MEKIEHLSIVFLIPFILYFGSHDIYAQNIQHFEVSAVKDVSRDNYKVIGKPDFIEPKQALSKDEMHIFDPLSDDEIRGIGEKESPKAVGIGRNLKKPVEFDLSRVAIPEQGEISSCGGRLSRINDQTLVWTTRIQSYGASELRIFFSEGFFPAGVTVNLFDDKGHGRTQPELSGRVSEQGFFTTTGFADHAILQLIIPVEAVNEGLYFNIPMIIHVDETCLKREIFRDCYEDVSCEEAGSFPLINNLKSSVAWLLFYISPYYYICTGTLLNDSREKDFQPFLLTASHCINSQTVAASLEARFDYFTLSCNGPVNENIVLVNGSNLMATNSDTDFTILLLNQYPSGNRVFNGWITTAAEDDEIFHAVHHPGGLSQQYSRLQNKYAPVNLCSGTPLTHFYYTRIQAGRVAGGSSGAAIVNANGQVAGQLKSICLGSGYHHCNFNTYYVTWGKFDVSFAQNNLQYWLANGGAAVELAISEASLSFAEVPLEETETLFVDISNSGFIPDHLNLEINNLEITGANADEFSTGGDVEFYLPPGSSGTVAVQFTPFSTGTKSATLNIHHNADNLESPLVLTVSGNAVLPIDLLIENKIILNNQNICFAASRTITVAGNNTFFSVENGGVAELVAGANVIMNPGTSVASGGSLHARIAVNNDYCANTPEHFFITKNDSFQENTFNEPVETADFISIYPNPTSGKLTIDLSAGTESSAALFEIFNMLGERVVRVEMPGMTKYLFDLSDRLPGLYFIRITKGDETRVVKVIRH